MAQHRTKLGPCDAMRHNPWNGVQCLGHANGVVTMWTPNVTVPVVRLLCHKARAWKQHGGGRAGRWKLVVSPSGWCDTGRMLLAWRSALGGHASPLGWHP